MIGILEIITQLCNLCLMYEQYTFILLNRRYIFIGLLRAFYLIHGWFTTILTAVEVGCTRQKYTWYAFRSGFIKFIEIKHHWTWVVLNINNFLIAFTTILCGRFHSKHVYWIYNFTPFYRSHVNGKHFIEYKSFPFQNEQTNRFRGLHWFIYINVKKNCMIF